MTQGYVRHQIIEWQCPTISIHFQNKNIKKNVVCANFVNFAAPTAKKTSVIKTPGVFPALREPTPNFSQELQNIYILKKHPQVCERCVPNRTLPNGRPKEDGGRGVG